MPRPGELRARAIDAADVLNDFLGDFVTGVMVFREYSAELQRGKLIDLCIACITYCSPGNSHLLYRCGSACATRHQDYSCYRYAELAHQSSRSEVIYFFHFFHPLS